MAYTINANAKNVWIRDNEDTRDLSIQTDASSVYLDNGRTLEQELGEGSMVSNVATVDTSMSKVIDGTLDGAYESLMFKGKSLVNVIGKITVSNNAIDNRDGSYTINKNTAYSRINIFGGNPMIKVGTPYYFTVIASSGTLSNLTVDVGTSVTKQQLGSGKYLITLTEESFNIAANRLFWYQSLSTTSEETVTIYPILVEYQQGMENWDIPFFTGMCDVKMPILRNVGKNLLNPQSITYTSSHTSTEMKMKNSLKPNVAYTISFDRNGISWAGRSFYVKGEGFSSYRTTKDFDSKRAGITFSLTDEEVNVLNNDDKSFLQLYSALVTSESLRPTNIQIEESSTRTVYEDHKTNILRTSEEIVLREVGGVCDTYNPLTGEYVQRIGELTFDGSSDEAWIKDNDTKINTYVVRISLPNSRGKGGGNGIANIISVEYVSRDVSDVYNMDIEGIGINMRNELNLSISNSKLSTIDIEGIKQYLSQKPLTVQYELAEPITTIVEPLTIPFAYQNGHIILESGSEEQSLLPTLEYSTVVNRTGQVEGVAKVIQKQEKQLTMLEQMLIQNIIGLDYNNTVLALNLEINEVM